MDDSFKMKFYSMNSHISTKNEILKDFNDNI